MRVIAIGVLAAVTAVAEVSTRTDEIQAEREAKSAQLAPDIPNRIERGLSWVKNSGALDRFSEGVSGFRVKLGGLVAGSGFAAGPEYKRDGLLNDSLNFRASAQLSSRGYQKQDLQLDMPRVLNDRFSLTLYGVHHNYGGLNYYGPGTTSYKSGRSAYRLEDTALDATLNVRVARHLVAGGTVGYLFNNVGPGNDSRYVSSEQIYHVPGIDQQSNYSHLSVFAQYDTRDYAPGPRAGCNYFIQLHDYNAFRRLDAEAQQYIPFFNKRRVIALRAKTALTFSDGAVPFYMQPTLGGSDDLRGFRPFRFRDNNLLLMNAEYRWEVFSGLDMAVFGDAGKVFARKSDFNFDQLQSAAGFGFRFNARNSVFLRLDFGFSREGFQIAMKFNNLFGRGPVHTSSSMGDF
jgi:outer membrane protein assembly factor BamA